jgi:hypothetical protein
MKTARELVDLLKTQRPELRYAISEHHTEIGVWADSTRTYYPVIRRTITGEWVWTPYDIFVNGQIIDRKWIDV